MVKLGNEANPVPVLTQQANPTSPEGNPLPEYVPVPPLSTDYNSNANISAYANLVPSQLAAYNEWIAIQAYYHYMALAHNASIHLQEERARAQQQSTNLAQSQESQVNKDSNLDDSLQQLSLLDGATNSAPPGNVTSTRDNELFHLSQGNPNIPQILFNQGDMQLVPSFYGPPSTGNYLYGHPTASRPTFIAPLQYHSTGQQHPQVFSGGQQQFMQHGNREGTQYSPTQPAAIPPTPVFINNAAGVPVNLSHGGVQTESRGIFIGNLPYNTHWRDLRTFLGPAGTIIRCDVPRKPNNKGRGYATVLFASAGDAERACEMFNGTMYQGRQIRVRLDTYANTKSAEAGATVASASTDSASGGGSGSGGNQSSFYPDGDVNKDGKQGEGQGRRKSSASV
ncbi:hypothetical protein ABW20_dc0101486 [Dactylellina cionopaga]|nr:hypothetical protein ABW20_dc0101486 [Dactylellina cionopaga]